VAGALEALVDLGVHARDEERRHRLDVDGLALLQAALEAADVGLGHLRVLLDAEEQRDVDVAPLVDHLLDRGGALGRARDLDHEVGAIDALPVLARLLHRAIGVEGEVRVDLEGDEAVGAVARVVDHAQHVAGVLDVADRELLVDPAVVEALARRLGELLVVVVGAEDGGVEDRRVRGHAAQGVLLDQPLQLPGGDEGALDLVEPDARAGRGEGGKALVDLLGGHGCQLSFVVSA
jgi:hypothetical protein